MTVPQKQIVRELIRLSIENGFGICYRLAPIAAKLGIEGPLYVFDSESGVLWEIGPYGEGLIYISRDGSVASVQFEDHSLLNKLSCHDADPVG